LGLLGFAEIFAGLCRMSISALETGFPWAEAWDSRFGANRDVLLPEVQEELLGRVRRKVFGAIYIRPPVSLFSPRRIPALRSKRYPNGNPWITGEREQRAVSRGNLIAAFVARVMRVAARARIPIGVEIPSASQFLWLPVIKDALTTGLWELTNLDLCRHGSSWQKPTTVASSSWSFSSLSRHCVCARGHLSYSGQTAAGESLAALSTVLPRDYCLKALRNLEGPKGWRRDSLLDELTFAEGEPEEECEVPPHPRAAKGPPVSRVWARPSRWVRIAQARRRNHEEHINEAEARALLMALKHVGRSASQRGRKVMCLSDSLVVIGCMAKGRSSSWRMNRYCRQAASLTLFWGTRVYLRYISTKVNPADGPSRGKAIGPVRKHHLKR
jgi:hypothetical protein